jgi:hypothetical protein
MRVCFGTQEADSPPGVERHAEDVAMRWKIGVAGALVASALYLSSIATVNVVVAAPPDKAATASTAPRAGQINTYGVHDCGTWIASSTREVKRWQLEFWLAGYLTGRNDEWWNRGGIPENPLGELQSASQATVWMDNYCKANPQSDVLEGARTLFVELSSRAGAMQFKPTPGASAQRK